MEPIVNEQRPQQNDQRLHENGQQSHNNEQNQQQNNQNPQRNEQKPQQNNQKPQRNDQKPQQNNQKPQQNDQKPQQNDQKPQQNDQKPQQNDQKPQQNYQKPQQNYQKPQRKVVKTGKKKFLKYIFISSVIILTVGVVVANKSVIYEQLNNLLPVVGHLSTVEKFQENNINTGDVSRKYTIHEAPKPEPKEELNERMLQQLRVPLQNNSSISAHQEVDNEINQLVFESYTEKNKCDVSKGIHIKHFNNTVSKIANLLKMPTELTDTIIDAANFDEGKTDAVRLVNFQSSTGYLYFGRFAVVKISAEKIAFSFATHGVKFQLAPKELQPHLALKDFLLFSDTIKNSTGHVVRDSRAYVTKKGLERFNEYFLHKATEQFEKECAGMLNVLKNDERRIVDGRNNAPTVVDERNALTVHTNNTKSQDE